MATVKVAQGSLRGGKSVTENGVEYYEFLEIPYAKPPVGDLRFRSPQSPDPWDDVRDATKYDPNKISCQMDLKIGQPVGSEDCLYLNVYTPQLPSSQTSPLPVVFYIHGGGFIVGAGILKDQIGPDYLIENNTVVVTINYRLGALGFLSLDIPEAAGNMGLKDQSMALQWVKENISEFGGDSYNVTIVGLSAGSASVEYQILYPQNKGLFHKAILQSGSAIDHWAINFKPLDIARSCMEVLEYKGSLEDSKSMYDFLLNVPAEELIKASTLAIEKCSSNRLFLGFVPTVEKDFGNNDAFITKSPYELLKEGKFNHVPNIRGFCNKEGSLVCIMKPKVFSQLVSTKDFVSVWPCEMDTNEKDTFNSKFSSAYLGKPNENESDLLEDFFSDIDFVAGVLIAAKLMSRRVPVYVYEFSYDGNINFLKKTFNIQKKGAVHGDDFTYLFKHNDEVFKNPNEQDIEVRKRVVKLVSDFVKTGEPVPVATTDVKKIVKLFSEFAKTGQHCPEIAEVASFSWELFTETSPVYLGIDKEISTLENYRPEQIAIFEELYEKYYGNQ